MSSAAETLRHFMKCHYPLPIQPHEVAEFSERVAKLMRDHFEQDARLSSRGSALDALINSLNEKPDEQKVAAAERKALSISGTQK